MEENEKTGKEGEEEYMKGAKDSDRYLDKYNILLDGVFSLLPVKMTTR